MADLSRHEAGGDAELSGYAVMACGMGVAQMAHGAATVVFDSTAQKLFELPNSLHISQIFARTGRGDRRWLHDMTRTGEHGGGRFEQRTLRVNIPSGGDRAVRINVFYEPTVMQHAGSHGREPS